jgi:hypothetical protein
MIYRVQKPKDYSKSPLEVNVLGVDFGKRPILWEHRRNYLVLKISGGQVWASRGAQRYAAAYFQVCKITEENETEWICEEIIDFTLRGGSR